MKTDPGVKSAFRARKQSIRSTFLNSKQFYLKKSTFLNTEAFSVYHHVSLPLILSTLGTLYGKYEAGAG